MEFIIPTRGLFGYRNEFLTETKGLGIMNTVFFQYMADPGNWKERDHGSLISTDTGPNKYVWTYETCKTEELCFLARQWKFIKDKLLGKTQDQMIYG